MGHGMFVRPTALKVLQPTASFMPQPAKKPARPSSMLSSGSSRGSTNADSGMTKRMSLSAPSPTPGQKPSHAASDVRVRFLSLSLSLHLPLVSSGQFCLHAVSVSHQVAYQAAGLRSGQWSQLAHQHPVQCKTCAGGSSPSVCLGGSHLDCPALNAYQTASAVACHGYRPQGSIYHPQACRCSYPHL